MPAQHDVFSAVCNALLGALNGSGFTLRNLNVTALADTRKQSALTGLISMVQNTHFLIEGCTFLHLAAINSSGVPAPAIMDRAVSTFTMGAQNAATTQFESQSLTHTVYCTEQVPIFSTLMASEGVVRNNLWQVRKRSFVAIDT